MSGKYSSTLIMLFILPQVYGKSFPSIMKRETKPGGFYSWEEDQFPKIDRPSIPEECRKATLCESVENYPTEIVETILEKLSSNDTVLFSVDQLYYDMNDDNFNRVMELCETNKEKVLFPLAAKDNNNVWHFILNSPGSKLQGCRVHECLNGPAICSDAVTFQDAGFKRFKCTQKFYLRQMYYLNLVKRIVSQTYFQVPCCCSCNLEIID